MSEQSYPDEIEMTKRLLAAGVTGSAAKLLSLGAKVSERIDGRFPIIWAMYGDSPDEAAVLLDAGADPNARWQGRTALGIAIKRKCATLVGLMLERGADANATEKGGRSMLHMAAKFYSPEICKLLVSAGANLDVVDDRGATPLHGAAWWGSPAAFDALVRLGADFRKVDTAGYSPLHAAADAGQLDACRLLASLGMDPNAECRGSDSTVLLTPFQKAVQSGRVEVALYFIRECGSDPAERAVDGRSMSQLAGKHVEMKAALRALKTGAIISETFANAPSSEAGPGLEESAAGAQRVNRQRALNIL